MIGVPTRYIHTHVGLIHLDDFLASRRLIMELVKALDEQAVKSFAPRP